MNTTGIENPEGLTLVNNVMVFIINFLIILFFVFFSKNRGKASILAIVYSCVLGAMLSGQALPEKTMLISFIGNLVVSYIFFKAFKYIEGGFLYASTAIVACVSLWYISYLPIGHKTFMALKNISGQ